MLKLLAIFWMFLVVFCANCSARNIQGKDSHQRPTAPVPAIPQQQHDSSTLKAEKQQDIHAKVEVVNTPKKDFYDKAPVWINLVLVVVAVGTGITVGWQAWETRKAAEATSKSVDLMGQQVALQRAERRGVLEVATEEIEVSDMFSEREEWSLLGIIRLTNSGAFPLQIRGGRGGFIFDRSDTLDTVGDFSDLNCGKVWIRPKSRGHITVLSSPEITDSMSEFWEKMSIDPIEFRLEGTIFYSSLGLNWRRNFAYRWAADYTKALSIKNGFWEENPHGQNDEDQLQDDCPVPF